MWLKIFESLAFFCIVTRKGRLCIFIFLGNLRDNYILLFISKYSDKSLKSVKYSHNRVRVCPILPNFSSNNDMIAKSKHANHRPICTKSHHMLSCYTFVLFMILFVELLYQIILFPSYFSLVLRQKCIYASTVLKANRNIYKTIGFIIISA